MFRAVALSGRRFSRDLPLRSSIGDLCSTVNSRDSALVYSNGMLERTALATGSLVREACRNGGFAGQTSGLASGFTQANLVVLPLEWANDFHEFCRRNPKPCPLLDVTEPGNPVPTHVAGMADLRTDLPRYRIWRNGELADEATDIRGLWRDDFVSFLIGCSFTFEAALLRAGIPLRHIELGVNVSMYRTNRACAPCGVFQGPLVVSMRPLTPADAIRDPDHVALPRRARCAPSSRPAPADWELPTSPGPITATRFPCTTTNSPCSGRAA